MGLEISSQSYKDLQAIASQAYGHGFGEQSNGGKGYMGVMKSADGTVSVFKCLTHKSEYKAFEEKVGEDPLDTVDNGAALKNASDQLKMELRRLGAEAGVDSSTLEKILGESDRVKGLLSRTMVAKAVTEIAKAASGTKDAKAFWKDVKFAGTVKDTGLASVKEDKTIALNTNGKNVSKLDGVKVMKVVTGMPATLEELGERLDDEDGNIGKDLIESLEQINCNFFDNNIPKVSDKMTNTKLGFDSGSMRTWLFDRHDNAPFGVKTLRDPDKMTGWNRLNGKVFRLSMKAAFKHYNQSVDKAEMSKPFFMKKAVNIIMQQALARTYYISAGLEIAIKLGAEKKLTGHFEKRLLPGADDEKPIKTMDDILKRVSNKFEELLNDHKEEYDSMGMMFLSGGYYGYDGDRADSWDIEGTGAGGQIQRIVKKYVPLVYSEVLRCAEPVTDPITGEIKLKTDDGEEKKTIDCLFGVDGENMVDGMFG